VSSAGVEANWYSSHPVISADGQVVAFTSAAWNLDPRISSGGIEVYVHERATGRTECASLDAPGAPANGDCSWPSLSADGRIVAFDSIASNLVEHDSNRWFDVFVHERCTVDASWSNYGAGFPGSSGVPSLTSLTDPAFGTGVEIDLGNSTRGFTVAALFIGFERATVHSGWGGDLLVVPAITTLVPVPPQGARLLGDVPDDKRLGGVVVDLQAIELDPGAAHGVSFTAGLELVLGR
jgi:hypothetical protein